MMPNTAARVRSIYVMISLNLALMAMLVGTLLYIATLRDQVQATAGQTRQACARGNTLRVQVNNNSAVLRSFLAQAASTREQSAEEAANQGDEVSARIDRDAAQAYRALIDSFTPLNLTNCEALK